MRTNLSDEMMMKRNAKWSSFFDCFNEIYYHPFLHSRSIVVVASSCTLLRIGTHFHHDGRLIVAYIRPYFINVSSFGLVGTFFLLTCQHSTLTSITSSSCHFHSTLTSSSTQDVILNSNIFSLVFLWFVSVILVLLFVHPSNHRLLILNSTYTPRQHKNKYFNQMAM